MINIEKRTIGEKKGTTTGTGLVSVVVRIDPIYVGSYKKGRKSVERGCAAPGEGEGLINLELRCWIKR